MKVPSWLPLFPTPPAESAKPPPSCCRCREPVVTKDSKLGDQCGCWDPCVVIRGWDWTDFLVTFHVGLSFPIYGGPVPDKLHDACLAAPSLCRDPCESCSKWKLSRQEQREMAFLWQECGLASVSLLEVPFPGYAFLLSCLTFKPPAKAYRLPFQAVGEGTSYPSPAGVWWAGDSGSWGA